MPASAASRPAAAAAAAAASLGHATLYEALGVTPQATAAEIRQAYLRAARQHHPDRRQHGQQQQRPVSPAVTDVDDDYAAGMSGGDGSGSFLLVKEAWDTLSDPARRAAYDKALAERAGEDGGFVSEELEVEEMERDETLGGWSYPCRCGEAFQVLEGELPEGAAILVTCDGCSLRARVHRGRRG